MKKRQRRGGCRVAGWGIGVAIAAWLTGVAPASGQEQKAAPASPAEQPGAAPAAGAPEPPESPASAADLAALRDELKALREEAAAQKAALDAVSAELGAEREQRAEEVTGVLEHADKTRSAAADAVRVSGYVQADGNLWNQASHDEINQSNGNLINDMRFLIRRARLRASIEREYAAGGLEFDGNTVNGATARILAAEASAKIPGDAGAPPLLMLSIGLFKIPFGFEIIQSDRDRLFMERSNAERALFPGEYDVGARLAGGWRFARYAIAVQNGEPAGEKTWPGRDPNKAKDVSGRVGVETPIGDAVWISAGFSALSGTGFHPGTPTTKTTVQWNDANQNGVVDAGEIRAIPGMASSPSRNFIRFAYGADLRLGIVVPKLGTTVLYGELYLAQDMDRGLVPADPYGPLSRDMRELGGYVALTQEIGPHFALGVRYDYYDPDRDSADPARPLVPTSFAVQTVSVVGAAILGPVRLTAEYDRNANHSGRDAAGNPQNLDSDTVIVRGQVTF